MIALGEQFGKLSPVGVDMSGVPGPLGQLPFQGQQAPSANQATVRKCADCPPGLTIECVSEKGTPETITGPVTRPRVPGMYAMPRVSPRLPTSLPTSPSVVMPPDMAVNVPEQKLLWKRAVRRFPGEWGSGLLAKVGAAFEKRCAQVGGQLKVEDEDREGIHYVVFSCWSKLTPTVEQVAAPVAVPTVAGSQPFVSVSPIVTREAPADSSVSQFAGVQNPGLALGWSTKEDSMSELGVLDLSNLGETTGPGGMSTKTMGVQVVPATGAAVARVQQARSQRQQKNMARIFKRFPQLAPATAAVSMQTGRMGRAAPLVMANLMMPHRASTTSRSNVIDQQTGVASTTGDTLGPGDIQASYSPESYAAHRGWLPGAGVTADVTVPWKRARRMGVVATVNVPVKR